MTQTAPYFHDGSSKTLEQAIDRMSIYQLDRPVSDAAKADIIAFLNTLVGELPKGVK